MLTSPITENITELPEDFRAFEVDLSRDTSHVMNVIGCHNVIYVSSGACWNIYRIGSSEPKHLDFFYNLTGCLEVHTRDGMWRADAGQFLFIPSWKDRRVFTPEASNHIYVRFNTPEKYPMLTDIRVTDCADIEAVSFYTRQLLQHRPMLPDELTYRKYLFECLAIIFRRELHPDLHVVSPKKGERLVEFLKSAAGCDLSVEATAQAFGMSIANLRIFCWQTFARSPLDLINEIKMERARALLSYGMLSIDKIAEQLGYSDRFAFSKAFTRLNECTPVQFRKGQNRG